MNLKKLTMNNHKSAERKKFASILMSGSIDPKLYYKYLINQFQNYRALELGLDMCGFDSRYDGVYRTTRILRDIWELEQQLDLTYDNSYITISTIEYCSFVEKLAKSGNINALISHMYVRHFGDMYGGAMISKKIPGSGAMYEFEYKETLKIELRSLLSDDMAPDANQCFEFAIRLFEELELG